MMNQLGKILVGLFLAVIAFTFSTCQSKYDSYHLTAFFQDSEGITRGCKVTLRGVQIGSVTEVSLLGTNQVKVEMSIDQDKTQYILDNVLVTIKKGLKGSPEPEVALGYCSKGDSGRSLPSHSKVNGMSWIEWKAALIGCKGVDWLNGMMKDLQKDLDSDR